MAGEERWQVRFVSLVKCAVPRESPVCTDLRSVSTFPKRRDNSTIEYESAGLCRMNHVLRL